MKRLTAIALTGLLSSGSAMAEVEMIGPLSKDRMQTLPVKYWERSLI